MINLDIRGNFLTGTIPDKLWDATLMQQLNFAENDLTAKRTKIEKLSYLKDFHVSENQMTGSQTSEIGNLGSLMFTRFDTNLLQDGLPSELGRCTQLIEL